MSPFADILQCRPSLTYSTMRNKILVCGLPGSGKTTYARALATSLGAVHFDADEVRDSYPSRCGFSAADRRKHALHMKFLCDQVVKAGLTAVASFVCPTEELRTLFGAHLVIWMDTVETSKYADTNSMWQPPIYYDLRIKQWT